MSLNVIKPTKKSFSSMLNHLIDEYQKEGLVTPEEKLMFKMTYSSEYH